MVNVEPEGDLVVLFGEDGGVHLLEFADGEGEDLRRGGVSKKGRGGKQKKIKQNRNKGLP